MKQYTVCRKSDGKLLCIVRAENSLEALYYAAFAHDYAMHELFIGK